MLALVLLLVVVVVVLCVVVMVVEEGVSMAVTKRWDGEVSREVSRVRRRRRLDKHAVFLLARIIPPFPFPHAHD